MPPFQSILGCRFGRLVVHQELPALPHSKLRRARCLCDCGGEWVGKVHDLRTHSTKSCGCLVTSMTHGETRHGYTSPEYNAWKGMHRRCNNPHSVEYPNYGGRGITLCARWRNSFAAFLADMGRRPSAVHSIDRINNNGHYEPGNCRWATASEQNANKRIKTHCPRGHELTEANTYAYRTQNGSLGRHCKICTKARAAARQRALAHGATTENSVD